jgi:hypothetical protein
VLTDKRHRLQLLAVPCRIAGATAGLFEMPQNVRSVMLSRRSCPAMAVSTMSAPSTAIRQLPTRLFPGVPCLAIGRVADWMSSTDRLNTRLYRSASGEALVPPYQAKDCIESG